MTEIEEVKAQIKVLEKKLSFLEELEKTKSPCEKAFKEFYGAYPITDIADTSWDSDGWVYFEAGYNAAQKDYKVGEFQEQEEQKWDAVRESVKWCEEHPDKDPLDCLKPQTPEQVADGLKEAFREAVKQGVVSSIKSPTLYDVIYEWWEYLEDTLNMDSSIKDLVNDIEEWLPKEQSAVGSQNTYVECSVEGYNDCLNEIKGKLR